MILFKKPIRYEWAGGVITHQSWGNKYIHFYYDNKQDIVGFTYYNGTSAVDYTYVKNIQGDVVGIIDTNGNTVATYTYDAWGNITSSTGNLANINPIRYRGYYYDDEIDMYYLQSRYYDQNVGRFINSDDSIIMLIYPTIQNLYTYCDNNCITNIDPNGYKTIKVKGLSVNLNSKGFSVNVDRIFFSKKSCIAFANDVISKAGKNKKYKNMDASRIAVELLGHAILYFIGCGMITSRNVNRYIYSFYPKSEIKLVLISLSVIQSILGNYLYQHAKIIDVNNDEKSYRLAAFYSLWYSYPTF